MGCQPTRGHVGVDGHSREALLVLLPSDRGTIAVPPLRCLVRRVLEVDPVRIRLENRTGCTSAATPLVRATLCTATPTRVHSACGPDPTLHRADRRSTVLGVFGLSLGRMWNSMNEPVTFRPASIPFTMTSADRPDVTRYALLTEKRFVQLFRGVWIDVDAETELPVPRWADDRWIAEWTKLKGLRLLHPDVAGSHATAARLYGLPLPARFDAGPLHVASGSKDLRIDRPEVVLHRSKFHERQTVGLLDVDLVAIPLLVVQLASELTLAELVALGDAAIGRQAGGPYISLDELRQCVLDRPRISGRRKVERALALIRPTVDSSRETWLRLWLVDHGFREPVVHPAVPSEAGRCLLHPDLGYPELRIAIEYEGDQHRSSPEQFAADIRRRELLEAEGWVVLRVTKRTDMAAFARTLSAHVVRRGGRA